MTLKCENQTKQGLDYRKGDPKAPNPASSSHPWSVLLNVPESYRALLSDVGPISHILDFPELTKNIHYVK